MAPRSLASRVFGSQDRPRKFAQLRPRPLPDLSLHSALPLRSLGRGAFREDHLTVLRGAAHALAPSSATASRFLDGNTNGDSADGARARLSSSSAPAPNGTANSRPALILGAGIVHLATSMSISSQRVPLASPGHEPPPARSVHAQRRRWMRVGRSADRPDRRRNLGVRQGAMVPRRAAVHLRQRHDRLVDRVVPAVVPTDAPAEDSGDSGAGW